LLDTLKSAFDDFWPLPAGWEARPDIGPMRTKLIDIIRSNFAGKPLWGFKDPRTCRLLPLWRTIFSQRRVSARYVVLIRHPREIAASLAAQNGMSINHALLMTLEHAQAAEFFTRGEKRVLVTYEQLLCDWRATARRIALELDVTWPVSIEQAAATVDTFLDPARRHQRADPRADPRAKQPLCDLKLLDLADRQHDILSKAAHGKSLSIRALDRISAKLTTHVIRNAGWRESRSSRGQVMRLEAWAQDRTAAIEFLTTERDHFKNKLAEMPPEPPKESGHDPGTA
jgi:hypothetical protein